MNELIKVSTNENDEQLVSGRELHGFLGVETPYRKWFPRMAEYGFEQGIDYTPDIFVHPKNNQETIDHLMKLDMAKEISMIQRSEKGKQARQYFLQVEKAWNNPEMIVQRALQIQTRKVEALQMENAELKPKALFADSVSASHTSILVGDLAKLIKQNGVDIGARRLFKWLREKGYLIKRKGTDWNMPTQKSMDLGLFEVKETVVSHSDGHTSINKTPKVTGKGQVYFVNKFLNI
ncbi:phage antirepressor KilAC domain-containing protein [Enterococcus casseliflavus]|uniref:phage antirepressor KilAC domain-containing protein n=1 Tax=Enterococcus casseliflavus TaxID=37734 RepID=UPI002DBAC6C6|nr:phage antirepressor KilAC domain-containing protein [Enterococcus casseliflavus]MEB6147356.1 phage antirepressor KilAC domain-containing protein [Enterococcus casseliflavus]